MQRPDHSAHAAGNSRKNMMQAVEASLKRLGTDYIDLYWVHARDFTTPIEEVMRGLDDLVRQGKVLYVEGTVEDITAEKQVRVHNPELSSRRPFLRHRRAVNSP